MSDSDKTPALIMVSIILLSLFPVAGYLTIVLLLSHLINRNHFGRLLDELRLDPALFFLVASFGLSALLSKHQLAGLTGITVFTLQVALFTVIRSHTGEKHQNISIIRYLLLTSLFVSVFGIIQYYFVSHMSPLWIDKTIYKNIPNRAFSTLYNPNVLGSYFIMIISLAIAGFRFSDKKHSRMLNYLVLVTAFLCMLLTFSRGAWLGLAVSILIIFIFSREKLYILSILGLTAVLALPELDSIISRINLDFLTADSSNTYRWYLWEVALKTFSEHPVLGVGLGSFGFSLPSHTKAVGYLVSHAHNLYLHLLAETGILGFTAFFGYIGITMYVSFKLFRKSTCSQTRGIALGALGSCAGLLVHGGVDATLYLPQLSVFIWIMVAVIRNLGDLELDPQRAFFLRVPRIKPLLTRIFLHIK